MVEHSLSIDSTDFSNLAQQFLKTAQGMEFPDDSDENWRYSRLKDPEVYQYLPLSHDINYPRQSFPEELDLANAIKIELSSGVLLSSNPMASMTTSDQYQRLELFKPIYKPDFFCLGLGVQPVTLSVFDDSVVLIRNHHDIEMTSAGLRLFVEVKENVSATIIELITSETDSNFYGLTYEITCGQKANIQIIRIDLSSNVSLTNFVTSQENESNLTLVNFSLGCGISRFSFSSWLKGASATSRFYSLALKDKKSHYDLRILQNHIGSKTVSEMKSSNVLDDSAESVYVGLIRMQKGCKKSVALQSNKSLLLSKNAHADSIPNLDIQENDVRCDHASAVGPVQEAHLEYLQLRRIPPQKAIGLIAYGFLYDVINEVKELQGITYAQELIKERFLCDIN